MFDKNFGLKSLFLRVNFTSRKKDAWSIASVFILMFFCVLMGCKSENEIVDPVVLAPNISKSTIYQVVANDIDIPVGREISNDSIFETAAFTLSGKSNIEIVVKDDIDSYSIHPLSKQIPARKNGNRLSFKVPGPTNIMVKINNYPSLLLFSTPMETDIPDSKDENVLYFGPGTHNIGRLRLKSNQTVYIEEGARVYGTLEGYEVKNVKIRGRGILDGSRHTNWEDRIFAIYFERSENITIEGIGIREAYWWVTEFLLCKNVNISNINLFSFYKNNGGLMMDGCQGFTAKNSFILTNDDCICPHALNAAGNGEPPAKDYLFENMVLYNVHSGNGIRIGASFETDKVENWRFKNIDVLAHNGAAIIADHSDWATVEDLQFIDFYDEQAHNPTINFFIDSTRYSNFTGYKNERGNINNLIFENLKTPGGEIILKGYDANHTINNVYFKNSRIGDDAIDSIQDIVSNDYVTNVNFTEGDIDIRKKENNKNATIAPTSPDELIIDNSDPRFKSVGFDLKEDSQFWKGDLHQASVPEGFSNFKAAIYEPNIKGTYEVYLHWGDAQNKATNARWVVYHADGYSTKYFDQNNSSGWKLHGRYELNESSYVRLLLPGYFEVTDGDVIADSVKFVKATSD